MDGASGQRRFFVIQEIPVPEGLHTPNAHLKSFTQAQLEAGELELALRNILRNRPINEVRVAEVTTEFDNFTLTVAKAGT